LINIKVGRQAKRQTDKYVGIEMEGKGGHEMGTVMTLMSVPVITGFRNDRK
jgi:hypothetical protein